MKHKLMAERPPAKKSPGLNQERIQSADCNDGVRLCDYGTAQAGAGVEAVFDNLEARLVQEIEAHVAVVGCVAWLTSEPVLRALATRGCVSIVVQKEDFLRPDLPGCKTELRALYDRLPSSNRYDPGLELGHLSCASDPHLPAVRCVGLSRGGKVSPRMHHKFAVFLDLVRIDGDDYELLPTCVWTGSYNWTRNGNHSFENAVIINASEIVRAYFQEWHQVIALSEPLDWTSAYVEPEWREGT